MSFIHELVWRQDVQATSRLTDYLERQTTSSFIEQCLANNDKQPVSVNIDLEVLKCFIGK